MLTVHGTRREVIPVGHAELDLFLFALAFSVLFVAFPSLALGGSFAIRLPLSLCLRGGRFIGVGI